MSTLYSAHGPGKIYAERIPNSAQEGCRIVGLSRSSIVRKGVIGSDLEFVRRHGMMASEVERFTYLKRDDDALLTCCILDTAEAFEGS